MYGYERVRMSDVLITKGSRITNDLFVYLLTDLFPYNTYVRTKRCITLTSDIIRDTNWWKINTRLSKEIDETFLSSTFTRETKEGGGMIKV